MNSPRYAKRERPQARTLLEAALGQDRFKLLNESVTEVGKHLGVEVSADRLAAFGSARATLDAVWAALRARHEMSKTTFADLSALLHLQSLDTAVRDAEIEHQDGALRAARDALARLQDINSVGRLLDAGTEAVCSLGFDRAIISRVEADTWITEALHVDGDTEWALEILSAGKRNPLQLTQGLPEFEIVRRRRAILVTDVQDRDDVHRQLAESSRSRSYVAAPLMPGSRVIGFVHGDRYYHQDELTRFDRDLLQLFAEGFGFALERALLLERLADIRTDILSSPVSGTGRGMGTVVAQRTESMIAESNQARARDRIRAVPELADDDRLTRREMDVLRLLSEGSTNTRIAHRLVISESTVKSHVKSILRKLGASNRAEAVARWHQANDSAAR